MLASVRSGFQRLVEVEMRKRLLVGAGVVACSIGSGIHSASAVPASSLVGDARALDVGGRATLVQYEPYNLCSAPVPPRSYGAPLVYDSMWQCYLPSYLANRLP